MRKYKIALDVDGILANFYLAVCRRFDMPYKSIEQWHLNWLTPEMFKLVREDDNFWKQLPVLSPPESITFDFDCYMTAVPTRQLKSREFWLEHYGFPTKPVIISHNKAEDCLKHGIDVLIDDKPKTIGEVADVGLTAIRFIPPYFKETLTAHNSYKIIRHLDEVNNII